MQAIYFMLSILKGSKIHKIKPRGAGTPRAMTDTIDENGHLFGEQQFIWGIRPKASPTLTNSGLTNGEISSEVNGNSNVL